MRTLLVAATLSLAAVSLTTTFVTSAVAQEASSGKRVVVGKLKGAKPDTARKWLVEGVEGKSGYVLDEADTSIQAGASESDVADFAARTNADVVIVGKTSLGKKGWTAELAVHDGSDGHLIETVSISGRSFDDFHAELDGPLAAATGRPRPEATPEPVEEAPPAREEVAAPPPPPAGPLRPSPLRLELGSRLYSRSFRYTDPLAQLFPGQGEPEMDTYNLAAGPMPFIHATWYPAAHGTDSWLAHIGITGGFEMGVATDLILQENGTTVQLSQTNLLWSAGLRGRIPLAPAELGVVAKFTNAIFSVDGDENAADNNRPRFPDVDYKSIDLGGDFTWRLDDILIGAHATYLLVLDTGALQSAEWFPNARGSGVNLGVFGGYQLSRVFDLLVGVEGRSYGLDFNPVPLNAPRDRVAGGATDMYISAWLGLGITWPADEPSVAAPAADTDGAQPAGAKPADDFDSFD